MLKHTNSELFFKENFRKYIIEINLLQNFKRFVLFSLEFKSKKLLRGKEL